MSENVQAVGLRGSLAKPSGGLRGSRQLGEVAWSGNADYRDLSIIREERRNGVRSATAGARRSDAKVSGRPLPPLRRRATQPMRYAKRPPVVFG